MAAWRRLFPVDQCRAGSARFVSVEGLELALFHLAESDDFLATHNSCPHASGNLSAGEVTAGIVTCPRHHWQFDLRTGVCVHNAAVRVRTFPTRVIDGWVEADLGGD